MQSREPGFTGFEDDDDDNNTFFYIDGVEHTYWQLDTLDEQEKADHTKARAIFASDGLEATLKFLNTPW